MARIIADTTSCLPSSIQEQFQIPVVPQMIHFGEQSYTEGEDIDTYTFLAKLKASDTLPKTSAPPPEVFSNIFESYRSLAEPILCIHPSSDLSGTVRSAETASINFPDLDIHVIDTRLIASPLGIVVHQACLMNQQGLPANEIISAIQDLSSRGHIYFLVSTLEYLARGGRIGGASALIGNAFQIKPILTLHDGLVEPFAKERTFKKALEKIKHIILDEYPSSKPGHMTIMHADNESLAKQLADYFSTKLGIDLPLISNLPPAIITHAGPGAVAVSFFS
jgi:DegV family protein with EDD domain